VPPTRVLDLPVTGDREPRLSRVYLTMTTPFDESDDDGETPSS
jgi:hypothetical protein